LVGGGLFDFEVGGARLMGPKNRSQEQQERPESRRKLESSEKPMIHGCLFSIT
jgi:hypothetical protein